MSRRHDVQDATGRIEYNPGYGTMQAWGAGAPSNGVKGFAPGCIYHNLTGTTGSVFYINVGTFASSTWEELTSSSNPATILASVTAIQVSLLTAQGFLYIPLESFRAIASNDIPALAGTPASGILAADTAPKLKRVNAATDKALKIEWAASSAIEIAAGFTYPPDMDVTAAYTVNLRVKMGGATDTPTTALGVFEGVGDTNRGGTSGAASSTLSTVSVSVTPTTGHPNFASLSIIPGAHTTDVYAMNEVYILYKKKLLTS